MQVSARTAEVASFYDLAADTFDLQISRSNGATKAERTYDHERQRSEDIVSGFGRGRLVDVGAGTGYWLPYYVANVDAVVALEPSLGMRRKLRERLRSIRRSAPVKIVAADHRAIIGPDFDTALIAHVLGHHDPAGWEHVIATVSQGLRPGGEMLVIDSVWNSTAARLHPERVGYAKRTLSTGSRSVFKHYFTRDELVELTKSAPVRTIDLTIGEYFWWWRGTPTIGSDSAI